MSDPIGQQSIELPPAATRALCFRISILWALMWSTRTAREEKMGRESFVPRRETVATGGRCHPLSPHGRSRLLIPLGRRLPHGQR